MSRRGAELTASVSIAQITGIDRLRWQCSGGYGMNVREIMSPSVKLTSPGATLQGVAQMMAEYDTGVLPVGENDRLIGMITDRDIVLALSARVSIQARPPF